MEPTIFRFVLRYSLRDQILVTVLTAASMPFVYLALEVPKRIINEAIGGAGMPESVLGVQLDQVSYLFLLCGVFLFLTFLNGALKYVINVYRGVLGERMLRRLRYQLYHRLLRFPLPRFKHVSQGEIIPMITAETEPLGGFIGDAFALPAFQGGLLVTYLFFIFNQDPLLGLVATSMYPFQAFIIPRLQKKVNQLARRRVMTVRGLSDRIGESVAGIAEIHANDTSHFERADVGDRLGQIYRIRLEIYRRKFFIKFFNNFLTQVIPFFFYAAGGYYVIMGELSLGALVAALAAYKDVASPWNELLKYYQTKEDVRVKYDQIIEQFDPPGLLPEPFLDERPESIEPLRGAVEIRNLVYAEEPNQVLVDGVSACFDTSDWLALIGGPNSGKTELARLLAGLVRPDAGRVEVAGQSLVERPQAVLGRRIGYVEASAHLFAGSIRDNLFYGLKHQVAAAAADDPAEQKRLRDARLAGNSLDSPDADWLDYAAAGAEDAEGLRERVLETVALVQLEEDLFRFGLRSRVDGGDAGAERAALVEQVLAARAELGQRLRSSEFQGVVESFDPELYNHNASLAENLVFGSTNDPELAGERLAGHPYVGQVLERCGLRERLLETGREVAQTMVELFADLSPGHEFFQQFSFIEAEHLPEFQAMLGRIDKQGMTALDAEEQTRLLSLAFRLVPSRHRLGLLDDDLQAAVLHARREFATGLPDELAGRIEFFDADRFNPAVSVQDNILFGRLAYGQALAESRLNTVIHEVVDAMGLRQAILGVGLEFLVGTAGSRLSQEQRQKVALARALLKRPDWLIVNGGSSALDAGAERRLMESIRATAGCGVVWALDRVDAVDAFDLAMVLDNGRVTAFGKVRELRGDGGALDGMIGAHKTLPQN